MGRQRDTKELVLQVSNEVLSTVTDMVLAVIYCMAEHAATPRSQWGNIDYKVMLHLERFGSTTIKRALQHLHQQGYIRASKIVDDKLPEITLDGIQKIRSRIPIYNSRRPWDKHFYLISYDLPMIRNSDRDYLRYLIKLLGCVRLQQSVWLTPYHPQNFLPQTLDSRNLSQIIAVSRLDSNIGIGAKITKLVPTLYPLSKLNQRYQQFISSIKTTDSPTKISFDYWQILRDDPQLPFELLPKNWLGNKAYQLFKEKTKLT